MKDDAIQLEMNFEGESGNRFKNRLDNGSFQILVELNCPSSETKTADAVSRYAEIEYLVSAQKKFPAGLSFNDRYKYQETVNTVNFAAGLCKTGRDCHVFCLSGRDRTPDQLMDAVSGAMAEGFKNFISVSGETVHGENAKQTSARLFTESVHTIKNVSEKYSEKTMIGCVTNPFKYTPCDSFTQYFKLVKKINLGASFIISQFGWDMLKLQELRWNLYRRSLHVPSIARFMMLTPDKAEEICSGKHPGVHISPDFQAGLRREMMHSLAQFEAAQWRRLQIHAAGAKLLGYSGLQLAGIDRADQLNTAFNRIAEALNEFQSFEDWRDAYTEYYSRMEMAPYPYRFYLFDELFTKAHPAELPKMRNAVIPPYKGWEMLNYKLSKSLFSHAYELPATERRLTKKLLASCRSCPKCRLPLTSYICPEICPKGLANGPCGASKADGSCEFGNLECIHSRRIRLLNAINDYESIETVYVPPVTKRR